MTFDVDVLRERLAARPSRKGTKKAFVPVTREDLAYGKVLAFDQTLTKCGWSLLVHVPEGLWVVGGGLIKIEVDPKLKSHAQTLEKAHVLEKRLIAEVVVPHLILGEHKPEIVAHEQPSLQGYRIESSLMAAREVQRVVEGFPYPIVVIQRRSAYATLVGDANASKTEGTKVVNRLIPPGRRTVTAWNQDVHDSVLIGLKMLHEKKRVQA